MTKTNLRKFRVFFELIELVDTLRDRCPWDRRQTLNTIKNNVIEEAYEVVNAIEEKNISSIKEEVGDLLFLGIFLSKILEEKKGIRFNEIIRETIKKYKTKHPHVFKTKIFKNSDEVVKFWHNSKKDIFQGIPYALPALMAAQLIQERAARMGFDWDDVDGPLKKLKEEIDELKKAKTRRKLEEEMGDFLFSYVNLARHLRIDPEEILRKANKKFVKRFRNMQKKLEIKGIEFASLSIKELDKIWEEIKSS